ncbi:MAG: hypothetical protein NTZ67_03925 [Gammaproteobacteria bacterium]|nr:hypothetical protein [Gammaproteobacteria bacterium]
MPKTSAITNPNDPRQKLENDKQFFAAVLDIFLEEKMQQDWQIEGRLEALKSDYVRKKILESTKQQENMNQQQQQQPARTPSTRFAPPEKEAEKPVNPIPAKLEACKKIITKARTSAVDAVKKHFANDPVIQEKAVRIAEQTFSPEAMRESTELYQQTQAPDFNRAEFYADIPEYMHSIVDDHYNAMENARATGNSTLAQEATIKTTLTAKYARGIQAETKQSVELFTAADLDSEEKARVMTAKERAQVIEGRLNILTQQDGAIFLGYAKDGAYVEKILSDDSKVKEYMDANPDLFKGKTVDQAEFMKMIDAEVSALGGKVVGEQLKSDQHALKTAFVDVVAPHLDAAAKQIAATGALNEVAKAATDVAEKVNAEVNDTLSAPAPSSNTETAEKEQEAEVAPAIPGPDHDDATKDDEDGFTLAAPTGDKVDSSGEVSPNEEKPNADENKTP